MADGTGDRPRYHAFISYSHRDAAFGRRLHRRLEGYRLPRRLVGRPGRMGPAPARLSPIFRDREELPAAGDLSAEVQVALAASAALVVVCSPSAAASPWVGREIETFRALHPDRPILAAVVQGEPADCFPEALSAGGIEPLAADFRKSGDGPRLGLLKLAAGIAGVGLDELVQRDAQRQVASVTAITAGALTLTLVMAAMTAVALDARAEAERQRAEAEGLVGFMLGDLREKLKGVGRLDVMTAVNERALAHYGDDLKRLSPDQLAQRAAIFHALGEDNMRRDDLALALAQFEEARRTTTALLDSDPENPRRIFEHAQNEFWVAYVAYERQEYSKAKTGYGVYRALAGRLVAKDPGSIEYRKEVAFAEGGLCAVALKPPRDTSAALKSCKSALTVMEAVAKAAGPSRATAMDLANRHTWMADAYRASGDQQNEWRERLRGEALIKPWLQADPEDMDVADMWIGIQRSMARAEKETRRESDARSRLRRVVSLLNTMIRTDPENVGWAKQMDSAQAEISSIESN